MIITHLFCLIMIMWDMTEISKVLMVRGYYNLNIVTKLIAQI